MLQIKLNGSYLLTRTEYEDIFFSLFLNTLINCKIKYVNF